MSDFAYLERLYMAFRRGVVLTHPEIIELLHAIDRALPFLSASATWEHGWQDSPLLDVARVDHAYPVSAQGVVK